MKKNLLFVYCMLFITALNAQQEAGFENFNMKAGLFKNGSDGAGGFTSGGFRFLNSYLPEWYSWSGFAVSAVTDNQLKGWENQYCAIPGRGALNTSSYAVSYVFDKSVVEFPETVVTGFYVTNNTYAYWSMKEGNDGFPVPYFEYCMRTNHDTQSASGAQFLVQLQCNGILQVLQ